MVISGIQQSDSVLHICVYIYMCIYIYIYTYLCASMGFPSEVKNPPANTGDEDSSPGCGRGPGERNGNHR